MSLTRAEGNADMQDRTDEITQIVAQRHREGEREVKMHGEYYEKIEHIFNRGSGEGEREQTRGNTEGDNG